MKQVNMAICSPTRMCANITKPCTTTQSSIAAVSCADRAIADHFKTLGYGVPVYESTEEMLRAHPESRGGGGQRKQPPFRGHGPVL